MNYQEYLNLYFLGAGGIGMSSLIRYCLVQGKKVGGYDKTPSPLTEELISEGAEIHFIDDTSLIPSHFLDSKNTLIVRTPAVPETHSELNYFRYKGFTVIKRAEFLGLIANSGVALAVAGTHGKTSVSTFISHIILYSEIGCTAFFGGISKNYNTNFLYSAISPIVVAEADEFDRSFLHIHPRIAVITSTDADHLDIYGNRENMLDAFSGFVAQIQTGGILILKEGLDVEPIIPDGIKVYRYGIEGKGDFSAINIETQNGFSRFDLLTPNNHVIKNFRLQLPGRMNIENAVAANAAAFLIGVTDEHLIAATSEFQGVKRRFDYIIRSEKLIYIDDYAHHPRELSATILTLRDSHPGKKITGIFQPHLYSRTRDFANGFAKSLSLLDELILLDIYPAREEPVPGVDSNLIFTKVNLKSKSLCSKNELMAELDKHEIEVLITLGAGDIDRWVEPINDFLIQKYQPEF
jgi:UDP-N-acetylmuramate--alanine ligase